MADCVPCKAEICRLKGEIETLIGLLDKTNSTEDSQIASAAAAGLNALRPIVDAIKARNPMPE